MVVPAHLGVCLLWFGCLGCLGCSHAFRYWFGVDGDSDTLESMSIDYLRCHQCEGPNRYLRNLIRPDNPPPASQTTTPSNLVLLHYGQARWNVLHLWDTLEAATNADEFATARRVAGIDATQEADVTTLFEHARERLLPFATADWARIWPSFVRDLSDLVSSLAPGALLQETMVGIAPALSVAPASPAVPALPKVLISAAESSSSPSPSPSLPSPVALPSPTGTSGPAHASLSGRDLSPQSARGSDVSRASRSVRSLPGRTGAPRLASSPGSTTATAAAAAAPIATIPAAVSPVMAPSVTGPIMSLKCPAGGVKHSARLARKASRVATALPKHPSPSSSGPRRRPSKSSSRGMQKLLPLFTHFGIGSSLKTRSLARRIAIEEVAVADDRRGKGKECAMTVLSDDEEDDEEDSEENFEKFPWPGIGGRNNDGDAGAGSSCTMDVSMLPVFESAGPMFGPIGAPPPY
ncbi:hypothetical protein BGY98DRAFT_932231 [Russula aff. rugulosa BPL654]|nr:hypothetical protein BGY98DRAFT_932231 [Russula aff. rugulosa BPL654]